MSEMEQLAGMMKEMKDMMERSNTEMNARLTALETKSLLQRHLSLENMSTILRKDPSWWRYLTMETRCQNSQNL